MRTSTKFTAAVAAGAVAVATAGVAYAYWSAGGTGTTTDAAALTNGTVVYTVTFDAATLAPGTTVPISYSAATTGATDLQVVNPVAVVSSSVPACDAWLSVSQPTQGATTILAGQANAMGGGFITFANNAANQNACKGQDITVAVNSL